MRPLGSWAHAPQRPRTQGPTGSGTHTPMSCAQRPKCPRTKVSLDRHLGLLKGNTVQTVAGQGIGAGVGGGRSWRAGGVRAAGGVFACSRGPRTPWGGRCAETVAARSTPAFKIVSPGQCKEHPPGGHHLSSAFARKASTCTSPITPCLSGFCDRQVRIIFTAEQHFP